LFVKKFATLDLKRRADLVDVYYIGSMAWQIVRGQMLRAMMRSNKPPPE